MNEILIDFKAESKGLADELVDLLDQIEGDFSQVKKLEKFGQIVDRIMGAAKSIALMIDDGDLEKKHIIEIGKYAEICKLVGYKGSQIEGNEAFYDTVVALLQDATETLQKLVNELGSPHEKGVKDLMNSLFLDRLKWVSQQFDARLRGSIGAGGSSQSEVDALLKQIGFS